MLRSFLFATALLSVAPHLSAAPCVPGILESFITATTCTSFGVDFNSWTYGAGGTPVTAAEIMVFPSAVGPVFEFTVFSEVGWAAAPGVTRTPSIFFTATAGAFSAVGSRLFLGSGSTAGTGSISTTLDACLGDLFAGGCVGATASLFAAPPFLLVTNALGGSFTPIDLQVNMTIVGGSGGAQISSVQAGLFVVPEPGTLSLMGTGLAMAALRLHARYRRRKS